jgi:hypothetical protein
MGRGRHIFSFSNCPVTVTSLENLFSPFFLAFLAYRDRKLVCPFRFLSKILMLLNGYWDRLPEISIKMSFAAKVGVSS